jgi:ABC-2 type transport system ATP-binding protein
VLFDHGRVVTEGTTAELKASIGAGVLHLRLKNPDQCAIAHDALSRTLDAPTQVSPDPAMLTAPVTDPGRAAEALATLSRQGIHLADFALGQPSLDEVFLALTGGPPETDQPAEQETA